MFRTILKIFIEALIPFLTVCLIYCTPLIAKSSLIPRYFVIFSPSNVYVKGCVLSAVVRVLVYDIW